MVINILFLDFANSVWYWREGIPIDRIHEWVLGAQVLEIHSRSCECI